MGLPPKHYGALLRSLDISGFTLDYLVLREGRPDLSVCDSLEKGVITLYNRIISRVSSDFDMLLEDTDIDTIILGKTVITATV